MKSFGLLLFLLLSACATIPSPGERRTLADTLAWQHGWQAETLPAGGFDLLAYHPEKLIPTDVLSIYIEGDGFAWISSSQASADPTPTDPLALRLALAQPQGHAVYLARPCQYIDAAAIGCPEEYWTEMRFSPEVIVATGRAIDLLKQRVEAKKIILIGFSGGGAVASLVAARRNDVARLITVAGNLDIKAWTSYHRIHPLTGSLNPADQTGTLHDIRQWHLVGGKDEVVPPLLARNFARHFPENSKPVVEIFPEFDHHCCWVDRWPTLWQKYQATK